MSGFWHDRPTLVTGATGYVGSRLVTALLADQHQVVAASRNPERLNRFGWFDDVAAVALDASDPVSAQAALDAAGPVDVIYYLVHAIGQRDFRDADQVAAANVAAAARDAGVRRIVYLGGFVPADDRLFKAVYEVVTIQRDYGNRSDRKLARLKYTLDKYGVDWYRQELENRTGFPLEEPR